MILTNAEGMVNISYASKYFRNLKLFLKFLFHSGNKNKKKKNQKEKKKGDNASNVEAGEQVPAGNVLKKQEAQNGAVNSAM